MASKQTKVWQLFIRWIKNYLRKTPFLGASFNRKALISQLKNAFTADRRQPKTQPIILKYTHQNPVPHSEILQRLQNIHRQFNDQMAPLNAVRSLSAPTNVPTLFPRLEAEVIKACGELFHGTTETCGSITANNTDTTLLICRTYREYAKQQGIENPEIIISSTTHDDFIKAALDHQLKVVTIPADPKTYTANIAATEKAITKNTVLIVASAPSVSTGNIDPVADLGKIAHKNGVGLHVDATAGGYLLPLASEASITLAPFDFRLKEVTSIAVNTNKNGKTTEGPSMLLFPTKLLEQYQTKIHPSWQWGIHAVPRSDGEIAKAWANMVHQGKKRQVEIARQIFTLCEELIKGIQTIKEIEIIGEPKLGIIAIHSKTVNPHLIAKKMKEKGCSVNYVSNPKSFNISLTADDITKPHFSKHFLTQLTAAIEMVKSNPTEQLVSNGIFYGLLYPKIVKPDAKKLNDKLILTLEGDDFMDNTSETNANTRAFAAAVA